MRVGLQHILHLPKQRSQKCKKKKPVHALKPEVEQAFFLILLMLAFCPLSDELFLEATEASLFSLAHVFSEDGTWEVKVFRYILG